MLFKSRWCCITLMYPVPPSPIRVGRSAGPVASACQVSLPIALPPALALAP